LATVGDPPMMPAMLPQPSGPPLVSSKFHSYACHSPSAMMFLGVPPLLLAPSRKSWAFQFGVVVLM
jgi:hypothetical protein